MTDIKHTLATAFDDEPPLTIDKAAILKAGRRKSIFRRGYTAAAVFATVAAVAVPVLLWQGAAGGSGGGGIQVAAGPSTTAPVLTTAPPSTTAVGTAPPSTNKVITEPGSPATTVTVPHAQTPKPVTAERAAELSAMVVGSGTIPADAQGATNPRDPMDPWAFRINDGIGYLSLTDVITPAGRGSVLLHLRTGSAKCAPDAPTCEERQYGGRTVAVYSEEYDGIIRIAVTAATSDGAVMSATASNSNDKATSNGTSPPLTWEQLAKIATHPGFTF